MIGKINILLNLGLAIFGGGGGGGLATLGIYKWPQFFDVAFGGRVVFRARHIFSFQLNLREKLKLQKLKQYCFKKVINFFGYVPQLKTEKEVVFQGDNKLTY